jgi:hypothetical protein
MNMDDTTGPSLQAILDGAKCFGLTDDEAWQTVDKCLGEVGGDATVNEFMDELTGALARGVLAKQRGEPQPAPRRRARRTDHGSA